MKKSFMGAVLSLAMLMSVPFPAKAATDSTSINSWTIITNGSDISGKLVSSSGQGTVSGNGAMQLYVKNTSSNNYVYAYQDVSATKGVKYRLSGKIFAWRIDDNASLLYTTTNNALNRIANLKTINGGVSNQFKDISYDFTWNSDSKRLSFALTGSGTVLIDDLSLKQIEVDENGNERFGSELIKNGNFEANSATPEETLTQTTTYPLTNVAGWELSNWIIAARQTPSSSGIAIKEKLIGTPEGENMAYLYAGGATGSDNHAHLRQQVTGLSTGKVYQLTGKVKFFSNNTYFVLSNCTYDYGDTTGAKDQVVLENMFGGSPSRGAWQDINCLIYPTNPTVELRITADANRQIYVDGLSLKEVGSRKELMVNGGFEGTASPTYEVEISQAYYPASPAEDSILDETKVTTLSSVKDFFTARICSRVSVLNDIYDSKTYTVALARYKKVDNSLVLDDIQLKKVDVAYSTAVQNIDVFAAIPELDNAEYYARTYIFEDNMVPAVTTDFLGE